MFGNDLIGVQMGKLRHVINKPFQIGFSVLEWSKLKMAQFYAILKDAFGDKVRMLYTDTDSFFSSFSSMIWRRRSTRALKFETPLTSVR